MFTPARLRAYLPVFFGVVAFIVLASGLGTPGDIVFDETYYVDDARSVIVQGVEDGFAVHPPVGKWMIASGIVLFGDNAFGWRFAGALAGAAIVLLTYLIGEDLLRDRGLAALAALLALTDGLLFVMARIAMLDIFLGFWILLGLRFLLMDRERSGLADAEDDEFMRRGPTTFRLPRILRSDDGDERARASGSVALDDDDGLPAVRPRGHAFRWLAGIAFGLAIATKWSGLYALGAAGLLSIGWELAHRRRVTGSAWTDLAPAARSITGALVVAPILVYGLTYVPWLANFADTTAGAEECPDEGPCKVPITRRIGALADYQRDIWNFHTGLEFEHRYRAPAYTWLYMGRPVVYYWENCTPDRAAAVPTFDEEGNAAFPDPCVVEVGEAAEIIALGNPALWWLFLPALLPLASGVGRRDPAAQVIAAFWAFQFLPWLLTPRIVFFFYMTPAVPFLALTVAYAVLWLRERPPVGSLLSGAGMGGVLGFLIGFGVSRLLDTDPNLHWVTLGLAAFVGGAVGANLDRNAEPAPRRDSPWRALRTSAITPAAIALVAVALFVYLYPVLAAVPLPEDAVRQRWWFNSWI